MALKDEQLRELMTPLVPPSHSPDLQDRFIIAQGGPPPSQSALGFQRAFRESLFEVAVILDANVEDSREKSLAITKLEEALLWAGKAIFK